LCALERDRTELQDERIQVRDAALCQEARRQGMWTWFCRSKRSPGSQEFARFRCESPQINFSLARSLLRGLCDARRQARSSASISSSCGLRFPSAIDPP
jgi:hypothetical protein